MGVAICNGLGVASFPKGRSFYFTTDRTNACTSFEPRRFRTCFSRAGPFRYAAFVSAASARFLSSYRRFLMMPTVKDGITYRNRLMVPIYA